MTRFRSPLLVLDLDGTLVDTAADIVAALNEALRQAGAQTVEPEAARLMVGAGGRTLIERGLKAQGRNVTASELDAMFATFLNHYNDHIAVHSALYPGVRASLDRFLSDGFRLAVCTNKMEFSAVKLLTALDVADDFAAICGQDTFRRGDQRISKPDPDALLMTIERAGGSPQRALMVGDSRTDIDTAKAALVPVVAVDFGYTDTPVVELGPDRVISHFDQLWPAAQGLAPHLWQTH